MSEYEVTFRRYRQSTCTAEISAPKFIRADTFRQATETAEVFITGMREIDGDDVEYDIASVKTLGLRGKCFKGYLGLWQDPPSIEEGEKS